MAVPSTTVYSAYDLAVGLKLNFDPAIYLLSPQDAPLLTGFNSDGQVVLPTDSVDEIKFSWMDEEFLTPRSVLQVAATTGDTAITLATGDGPKFSTGDLLKITKAGATTETMRITAKSATDVVTVTRAFSGGAATNYLVGAEVIGLGTALAEGADPENSRVADRVEVFNFTQIFGPTAVRLSRTQQQISKYGIGNEFSKQMMNRMTENVIQREQAFLYGQRAAGSAASAIRQTAGLEFFITTNVDSAATQLTVASIEALQAKCYAAGGVPELLIASPLALSDLNAIGDSSRVRQEAVDTMRGRKRVSVVTTEYGDITIARDRWVAKNDAFLVKRDNVRRRIMQPLVMERLAKTGDSDHAMIVCEEGLQVKGQKHMARFRSLAY